STKFSYTAVTVFASANAGESNNVYFKVKLLDSSNKVIKSRTVIIRFNGVDYKVSTDSNGIAQLRVNLPTAGTYGFSVRFDGDDYYKASSGNFNIVVKKNTVKITAKTKKVKKSKSKRTVKFVLKTSKNKVLKSKKVKLTINKKTYTVNTNKKGLATFKVKLPNKKKTYKYKLAFAGDKMNSAKSLSGKLKVY
ncbi:MAG: Ig-like domain-containing protein, partial [Methanobrevibacter sp.]|nr:Ig-like domain-containing protein [Methanobrevibacter sp.]